MRDVLRFLFSASDAARIDPATITAQDTAYAAAPADNANYPQSLEISFSLKTGETVAPQIRPLFPGSIAFIPDAGASGSTPEPADVAEAAYPGWKSRGTLLLALCKPKDLEAFRDQFGAIEVPPFVVWYKGIVISKDFLFTTLVTQIPKNKVCAGSDLPAVGTGHADWPKHAISGFLKGRYRPKLTLGATAADDDVTKAMPVVAEDGSGSFNLVISCAARGRPQDARIRDLDALTTTLTRDAPAHPANGAIPARHVYRLARAHMIDGATGNAVADKILADWPQARRYFPVRCTRTWRVENNASIHFPQQRIEVKVHGTTNSLAEQRLALHGVFYLEQLPATPLPSEPHVDVTLQGGLHWLDGSQAHVWRIKASATAVPIDFSALAGNPAHLQLRLPMGQAMLIEPRDSPGGTICTYLSMRRAIRALIDNRITGGRLNFGRGRTSSATRALIDDAWSAAGSAERSRLVANNQPPWNATVAQAGSAARGRLLPIWEVFFPDLAPEQASGGNGNVRHTVGRVAYEIWQSNPSPVRANDTRNNYPAAVLGCGAAGALVVSDLATDFAVDGLRDAGEAGNDNAYFDRVANEMVTELEPGAALQFWNQLSDFEDLRNRAAGVSSYGHSPIYEENLTGNSGIRVIDQGGNRDCDKRGPAGNERLEWHRFDQEIWVAANWDE